MLPVDARFTGEGDRCIELRRDPLGVAGEHRSLSDVVQAQVKHANSLHSTVEQEIIVEEMKGWIIKRVSCAYPIPPPA